MSGQSEAPIYEGLVRERGDVLTEVRRAAQEADSEVAQVLDFRLPPVAGPPVR
jgi:hypothetical protein